MTPEQISQIRKQYGITTQGANVSNPASKVAEMEAAWAEYDKQQQKHQGFLAETAQDIGQTFGALGQTAKKTFGKVLDIGKRQQAGETGVVSGFLQSMGAVAGGAESALGDIITGIAKLPLNPEQEQKVKGFVESVGTKVAELPPIQTGVQAYEELKQTNPELARNLESLVNIGMLAADVFGSKLGTQVLSKGTGLARKATGEVVEAGVKGIKELPTATSKLIKKVEPAIKPIPTPLKAAGEVLQSKTEKGIASGVRGLAQLDTTGVNTFKDLQGKITTKISELAKQVDDDLAQDTTKTLLDDLVTSASTKAGTVVQSNPVKTALNQLEELYTAIGDNLGVADIRELIQKASNEGLTKLDVNNIARVYGSEFGTKAFGKTGEALTSVNARMYENTRKALKDLSRQGITGDAAKLADQAMSNLYDTEKLIRKNVEAVNNLKNKIAERGLLEKVGYYLSKYGDILTGGTIRGFVGGLLPRGAGYKVMNALDLEEVLSRNLKILQDAIKSNSDTEIQKMLKQLDIQPKPLKKVNAPASAKTTNPRNYKTAEEYVKAQINDLNPTGKILTEYTPEIRAKANLGENITTLDKTLGGNPTDIITVYRGTSGGEIIPGDFVTTNKQLAKDYAGTGNIVELKVKKGDILDDITEPLGEEYIYRPNAFQEKTKTKSQLIEEWNKANKK